MIRFLSRYRRALFAATIVIFLIGTFVGLGGYLFTSKDMSSAVATVGGNKIPYSRFVFRVQQYSDILKSRGTDVSDDILKQVKQEMLRDMIVEELMRVKADEMGIKVPDDELARDIQTTQAFQHNGAFSQELYFRALRSVYHDSPEAYENARRNSLKARMLQSVLFQTAKLAPGEAEEAYALANKGSMKDFDKKKEEFTAKLRQQRGLELINYYLRQLTTQIEIRPYLEQRESGQ
ncbi:MAG: SurA N-terminal domain-containing protein [Elusimicrobia bacterium]|nr:SurA N-terminal domain-containing protein [Elusimicrobiota bacterium]